MRKEQPASGTLLQVHCTAGPAALPFNLFLCMPGTIPEVSPYLGHGFACHHGKLQGLLPAFQFLSLHSGRDTMGVTVLKLSFCLPPSRQKAGQIVCLLMFFFLLTGPSRPPTWLLPLVSVSLGFGPKSIFDLAFFLS